MAVHLLLITNRSNMYNMNEYASSPSFIEQPKLVFWWRFRSPSFSCTCSFRSGAGEVAVAPSDDFESVGGKFDDVAEREITDEAPGG